MKHIRIALVLVLVPLALAVGAARASAQDITPNVPTTVPHSTGVVPGQVAQLADKVSADQSALYALLGGVFAVGFQVHQCEEGGVPNEWHVATSGPFQGGMGLMEERYVQESGHGSAQDGPYEQIVWAWTAHMHGARWAPKCEAFASQWP